MKCQENYGKITTLLVDEKGYKYLFFSEIKFKSIIQQSNNLLNWIAYPILLRSGNEKPITIRDCDAFFVSNFFLSYTSTGLHIQNALRSGNEKPIPIRDCDAFLLVYFKF